MEFSVDIDEVCYFLSKGDYVDFINNNCVGSFVCFCDEVNIYTEDNRLINRMKNIGYFGNEKNKGYLFPSLMKLPVWLDEDDYRYKKR